MPTRAHGHFACPAIRPLPLYRSGAEAYERAHPSDPFSKANAIQMADQREHIAFGVAERVEPTATLVRDDDNLCRTTIFHRSSRTFFYIDGKSRCFEDGAAWDTVPKPFYFYPVHFKIDRTAIVLFFLSALKRDASFPPRRAEGARARMTRCKSAPCAAKLPLRPLARQWPIEATTVAESRLNEPTMDGIHE